MHDLINDLAQSVAGEICSKLENDDKQQKFSNRTRHSSYVKSQYDRKNKFEAFDKLKSLRTFLPFMLMRKEESYLTNFVLDDLLPKMKCLRVLSLNGYKITELPDFFENLKHLRHVDFSDTSIKCLPDSLCTLYHLETLILRRCKQLVKFPSKIGNLMELHYLDITDTTIEGMPLEVGKLLNLQRLSNFILGEDDGHLIRELKNLSNLSGDFCISGLKNVKSQDARVPMLNAKSGITRLTLQRRWSTYFDIMINFDTSTKEEEERVMDFLCPQKNLKRLTIENYGGTKFSAWIADSSFKNLLSLKLSNCKNCKSLPSIGRLPQLKNLVIHGFNQVNQVSVEFYGENELNAFALLERLHFESLPEWEKWEPCEGDEVRQRKQDYDCIALTVNLSEWIYLFYIGNDVCPTDLKNWCPESIMKQTADGQVYKAMYFSCSLTCFCLLKESKEADRWLYRAMDFTCSYTCFVHLKELKARQRAQLFLLCTRGRDIIKNKIRVQWQLRSNNSKEFLWVYTWNCRWQGLAHSFSCNELEAVISTRIKFVLDGNFITNSVVEFL
ncbi:hypothetical protein DITRI_Ditri06bG0151100 [Diplodiscus trichospermus]